MMPVPVKRSVRARMSRDTPSMSGYTMKTLLSDDSCHKTKLKVPLLLEIKETVVWKQLLPNSLSISSAWTSARAVSLTRLSLWMERRVRSPRSLLLLDLAGYLTCDCLHTEFASPSTQFASAQHSAVAAASRSLWQHLSTVFSSALKARGADQSGKSSDSPSDHLSACVDDTTPSAQPRESQLLPPVGKIALTNCLLAGKMEWD